MNLNAIPGTVNVNVNKVMLVINVIDVNLATSTSLLVNLVTVTLPVPSLQNAEMNPVCVPTKVSVLARSP